MISADNSNPVTVKTLMIQSTEKHETRQRFLERLRNVDQERHMADTPVPTPYKRRKTTLMLCAKIVSGLNQPTVIFVNVKKS